MWLLVSSNVIRVFFFEMYNSFDEAFKYNMESLVNICSHVIQNGLIYTGLVFGLLQIFGVAITNIINL